MRILVIQTAFIGDVALTTPFLSALRQRWPDAQIDVVSTPAGCEMLRGLGGIQCFALDKRKEGLFSGLKKIKRALEAARGSEPYEMVFSVHRSLRSLWLGRAVPAKKRISFRSFWANLLGYETVEYPGYSERTHYADKPLALLARAGVEVSARPRVVLESSLSQAQLENFLGPLSSSRYLVISPFSVWGTKMWFADRFAKLGSEIVRRHGLPIVLIGDQSGPQGVISKAIAEKIQASGGQVTNLVGRTSLDELKGVIRRASAVVSNDSAPVHIAAAFNVPTVAIFGPTAKKWGFFPLSDKNRIVEKLDVPCRPCHIHGPERCPQKHFRCMDEIQVEDVLVAVEDVLALTARGYK